MTRQGREANICSRYNIYQVLDVLRFGENRPNIERTMADIGATMPDGDQTLMSDVWTQLSEDVRDAIVDAHELTWPNI